MELSPDMCEFIGAIIGDGNIYSTKKHSWVEMTGNPINDYDYFTRRLVPIVSRELNYNPRIFVHSRGLKFRICNKKFVDELKELGMPTGRSKHATVKIPDKISADWDLTRCCIRGIVDTDGCVSFDKRVAYVTPYPRIALHMRNAGLISQIHDILITKGFNPKCEIETIANTYLYLNGKEQVELYLKKIGFSNWNHLYRLGRIYPDLFRLNASVAQWQSDCFVSNRLGVQFPSEAYL